MRAICPPGVHNTPGTGLVAPRVVDTRAPAGPGRQGSGEEGTGGT